MYLERKREARLAAAISDNEGSGDELDEEHSDEDPMAETMAPSQSRRRSLAEPASPWASVALHEGRAAPEHRGQSDFPFVACLHVSIGHASDIVNVCHDDKQPLCWLQP